MKRWFCLNEFSCFFFKQKTAYEMRISDWSSDVCSSDLHAVPRAFDPGGRPRLWGRGARGGPADRDRHRRRPRGDGPGRRPRGEGRRLVSALGERSEEHTSELQSLMRISYAVFCLKKKKKPTTISCPNVTTQRNDTPNTSLITTTHRAYTETSQT